MVGITSNFLSKDYLDEWIVDSGATHHIVASNDILMNDNNTTRTSSNVVHLPNGDRIPIMLTGWAAIFGNEAIHDVLYVLRFKFNLLSVFKLTKELCCSVNVYPDFMLLQDLLQW